MRQNIRVVLARLPLGASAKRMIRKLYSRLQTGWWQSIRHSRPTTRSFDYKGKLATPTSGCPDYVVWGVIDWHFRHQRPQHLAVGLASQGRRVFYVSPALIDSAEAGLEPQPLDKSGHLFQVRLFARGAPVIYSAPPTVDVVKQLRESIGVCLDWADSIRLVSFVQHPFWYEIAASLPNSLLVYDCMDYHQGFGNNGEEILALEKTLFENADVTVTTSRPLDGLVAAHTERRVLIRNAADYTHFSDAPSEVYRDSQGRRVIGYYGAIAEWFDQDLVEAVAREFSDCAVLLIGADTVEAQARLGRLANIAFLGEVPYGELPSYLHGFDVCLLPFKVLPLTLATNPVKVYEYLSAGKPVVSVDLPEMEQFGSLIRVAGDEDSFLSAVRDALAASDTPVETNRRREFGREQSWSRRVKSLIDFAEGRNTDPSVSVVVVTFNNLDLTRACLHSLAKYSDYDQLEVIVVDNASSDGTQDFLSSWADGAAKRKVILNNENRGFAAANNQGMNAAEGRFLALLNNDTFVTPGWIRTLVRHILRDTRIGLIGPVTNNIGNEARIEIEYESMDEMIRESAHFTRRHIGQSFSIRTAALFCAVLPRSVFELIGPLDEAFGLGFFEDDDYCRRIEAQGLRVVCAEDVFIHHHLSASFTKMSQLERQKLFERNKKIYEEKWGTWIPHRYR